MKKQILMLAMLLGASLAYAQELQLPHKVDNVELEDLYGEKVTLPMWGEKNLLIFYIDPDKHKQNYQFTVDLEQNHAASGDNIYGFGIVNLKDSWYPVPNNQFVLMIVSKEGELVYMKKGELSKADQEEFYEVVKRYR